jgi:hypothetical protein
MIGPWGRPRAMRVASKSWADIRAVAVRARQILGITDHPINMVDLLENGRRQHGIHFHVVDRDAIPGEAARALPEKGLLLLTQEAYEAVCDRDLKHALLIPHEIGHFALGHAVSFARSNSSEPHGVFEDSEIQADQFSHEFMMPAPLVTRHCRTWEDVRRVFEVPDKDAKIRHMFLRLEGHFAEDDDG